MDGNCSVECPEDVLKHSLCCSAPTSSIAWHGKSAPLAFRTLRKVPEALQRRDRAHMHAALFIEQHHFVPAVSKVSLNYEARAIVAVAPHTNGLV